MTGSIPGGGNPIPARVAAGLVTPLTGPGFFPAARSFQTVGSRTIPKNLGSSSSVAALPPSAGGSGSSGVGGASGSSPSGGAGSEESDIGDIDQELKDIKEQDKKLKEREELQKKLEEENKAKQEELKQKREELEKDTKKTEEEKIAERKKLDDEEIALKATAEDIKTQGEKLVEERKNYNEKIAEPFAKKDSKGEFKKDDNGHIEFLSLEEINQLKSTKTEGENPKDKDTETLEKDRKQIQQMKEAIKAFRAEYRKERNGSIDPYSSSPERALASNQRIRKDLETEPPEGLYASSLFGTESIA